MLKMNIRGQVPVIKDGDIVMSESDAILLYLEENYPQVHLLPKNKTARALALVRFAEANNFPIVCSQSGFYDFVFGKKKREEHTKEHGELLTNIKAELKLWETHLAGKEYLAGEFSIADIALYPHLGFLERVGWDLPADKEFPNVAAWYSRMSHKESVKKSTPPHWQSSPANKVFG